MRYNLTDFCTVLLIIIIIMYINFMRLIRNCMAYVDDGLLPGLRNQISGSCDITERTADYIHNLRR